MYFGLFKSSLLSVDSAIQFAANTKSIQCVLVGNDLIRVENAVLDVSAQLFNMYLIGDLLEVLLSAGDIIARFATT